MNPIPPSSQFDLDSGASSGADSLFGLDAKPGPGTTPQSERRGLRLWRAEVLNWGTLGEDTIHAADLSGGWLCITGRNGTGKSTLADAIITAFPPANARIHYNAAGGAKNTKERTRLTYLRGFYGHEQDATGRAQPSALRSKPGSLTAILLQFHEPSSGRWVTLLVLGTFTSSQEEHWLYGVLDARADLSVVLGKEDWDTRAKRLRKANWALTADPGPYRDRLRTALRIPSDKAITTFVRTVGLKDIGDVNSFIRGNMLDDVSVHQRYGDLTKHYAKQLEIDEEIERTRRMIDALRPLATLVPDLENADKALAREPALRAATAWRADSARLDVLESLRRACAERTTIAQARKAEAEQAIATQEKRISDISTSDAAKRARGLQERADALHTRRKQVDTRAAQLRAALEFVGGAMPADASAFAALRTRLEEIVRDADANAEERQGALHERKQASETLAKDAERVRREIDAARRSGSHIPADEIARRDGIAAAAGLRPADLPYLGELIDVAPREEDWRVAIEKLFRVQARRILVPSEHFAKVAAHVNSTDFGARVRLERVHLRQPRLSDAAPAPDRVYGKLRVKPGTPFSECVEQMLRARFDHLCVPDLSAYERAVGSAITREGLVRERGDYHEKRDDIRVRDSRDHFLGWNNEAKLRALLGEFQQIEALQRASAEAVARQRQENSELGTRRDHAHGILNALPTFDLVDLPGVSRELAELEKDRADLARTDPEAALVERSLAEAKRLHAEAKEAASDAERELGGIETEDKQLRDDLHEIDERRAGEKEPPADDMQAIEPFFTSPPPGQLKPLARWVEDVNQKRDAHFKALNKRRSDLREGIVRVMSGYLSTFATEQKHLSSSMDAAPAFLDRLHVLESERLAELQNRFRKHLEENLALHTSQFKSELESQVSDAEERIEEINVILAQIPWEGDAVIRILPRPNPQPEIRQFRELLARAGVPLFQPTEEQNRVAFQAVKELLAFLADDYVRKLVLDARQWRLFAVELRDPTIADPLKQRKFYLENTDGLSGGQKNKLSVTLLASALAYQYDVAGARAVPGTFRTVIIDEAFARLDSENARYALELFKRFDFQLVLVHPLDGTVRVAEDYVQAFLLATIRDGRHTTLTSVRIDDFRQLVDEAAANAPLSDTSS